MFPYSTVHKSQITNHQTRITNYESRITTNRVFGLDIIRATAIILVMISHSRYFFVKFYPALNGLSICGYLGVELFFVLSGFLIGRILIRLISKKKLSIRDLIKFWLMRWMRTLPNYYLFLIIYLILYSYFFKTLSSLDLRYFFFYQNFLWPHPPFFPEAWSLCMEEWFYVLFPMVLFALARILKTDKKNIVLIAILIFICFSETLRFLYVYLKNPTWDEGVRKVTLLRLDAIILGVLFAWLDFYFLEFVLKRKTLLLGAGLVGLILCVTGYYIFDKNSSVISRTFYFFFTDLSLACFLPFFSKIKYPFDNYAKILTFVSLISYSMYLTNLSLVYNFLNKYIPAATISHAFVGLFFYWALTFALSAIIFYLYEKPILRYRNARLKL